jgi:hypothetical protein
LHLGDETIEVVFTRLMVGIGHRVRGEQLPEFAATGK